ncbi:MAG: 4-hydroxy-tetrahydrodipicolinate reductase [Bacteroidia bacterium]
MQIALIGYGKMGKAIEDVALKAGHTVVSRIDFNDDVIKGLAGADVAIEFTHPGAAKSNILKCFEAKVPVVVGTTGWYHDFDEIKKLAESSGNSLFYATNFSLGVNMFFELNKHLAQLMNHHHMYEPEMTEIHHLQKQDAPSGTAITLAEGLIANLDRKKSWVNQDGETKIENQPLELNIISKREGEVPGTHTITYKSDIDEIIITHQAYNRLGFATGAVKAAEWIKDKIGVYTMADLLGYKNKR